MLLRFPFRIKPFYFVIFALLLAMFQLMEGSDLYCVLCIFLFTVIAGDAFNRCEGFKYPSGSYVFFAALLILIVGATWKAILWQPVERNMLAPQLTFSVYLVGMCGIWLAAVINSRIRMKKPFLKGEIPPQHRRRSALGCLAVGLAITFMGPLLNAVGAGGVATALSQLNAMLPLSIMIAVYYTVVESNGYKSFSGVAFVASSAIFMIGVAVFSKQAMFTPFAAWIISALAAGYRTTVKQLVILLLAGLVAVSIIVPYSQYGRSHRDEFGSPFEAVVLMITHPSIILDKANAPEQKEIELEYHFYDKSEGFFDRLTMLALDDALIKVTNEGHTKGWDVVTNNIINILPHFILPNKPTLHYGNEYAHELGLLARDDDTTGVSFSPFSEGFHIAGWTSLVLLTPGLLLLLFWVCDSSVGTLNDGPWGLFFILSFAHAASEGGIASAIYMSSYGLLAIMFAIFVALKVAPLIGTILVGPEKAVFSLPARARVHNQP